MSWETTAWFSGGFCSCCDRYCISLSLATTIFKSPAHQKILPSNLFFFTVLLKGQGSKAQKQARSTNCNSSQLPRTNTVYFCFQRLHGQKPSRKSCLSPPWEVLGSSYQPFPTDLMKPSLGRARPMAQKRIWLNKFLISISREDPWDCSLPHSSRTEHEGRAEQRRAGEGSFISRLPTNYPPRRPLQLPLPSTHSWGTTSEGPAPEGDAGNFPLWITSLTAITQQRNITGWFACAGNFTFMGTSQGWASCNNSPEHH